MDRLVQNHSKRNKRWITVSVIGGLMLIAFLGYTWSSQTKLKVDASKITIEKISFGKFQELIPMNGTVQPLKTVYIDAVEGGTVEEIFLEDGREVTAGLPIVRLSNQQFQMDAINREAQLLDQQNNLRTARLQMDQQSSALKEELLDIDYKLKDTRRIYDMNKKLFESEAISKNEFEKSEENYHFLVENRKITKQKISEDSIFRKNQLGQVESSLGLIQRNLEFLEKSVENLLVRAPITGQLSSLQVELGETISQGERIAQIDVTNGFKVRAPIPEHYITRISPGLIASFDLSGKNYQLEIRKIYPEISNGQFFVDLHFTGEIPSEVRRGQTLQIRLALGSETEAMLLPRGAFFQQTSGNWIYVLTSQGRAEKREIKLGRQNPDFYEVLSGLETGDQVITSRYDHFNNSQILEIQYTNESNH